MEEDAGKLMHDENNPSSYVDLNRTGVPLIEIVSEPDIRSAEEAGAYLRRLHEILVYLEICDGNMEEGSFRCDANISIRPKGQEKFGTRAELKNMNSFRNVQRALDYEIKRQRYVLDDGGSVIQETRLWNDSQGVTHSMRGKEEAHDYRYFPDPDLVPLNISKEWIDEIEKTLPELPMKKRERFVKEYGIPPYDAGVLVSSRKLADFYEETVKYSKNPKMASNWIMGDFLGHLKDEKIDVEASPVNPESLGEMIALIDGGTISGKIAKDVFEGMWQSGKPPKEIIEEKGLVQITDTGELEGIVDKILKDNPAQLEQYRSGKDKLFGFFVGQAMKATGGKANPKLVNELLKKKLS
jgi:aspartyl-tRNA(Asn)/glutamyl-tRNA(Gln) amidotransferase subunit B